MQTDVSVFRTQDSLDAGVKEMDKVDKLFEQVGTKDRSMIWNTDLVETLELRNLLTCAYASHPFPFLSTPCNKSLTHIYTEHKPPSQPPTAKNPAAPTPEKISPNETMTSG